MKKYDANNKRWKKRQSELLKQIKKKRASQVFDKAKKVVPISPRHFRNQRPPWIIPVAFLSMVILIILVIPTLVVLPFIEKGEKSQMVEGPIETEAEFPESPFTVEVMRQATEKVEEIPLEEYVAGVVASEMPADFELEALKAQALAARTYTVNHLLHGGGEEEYDVTDTVQHQVYKSEEDLLLEWGSEFTEKMNKIKRAVNETSGEILVYEEQPITAAFFSTSNGYTENSEDYWETEVPYLRSVESPWDKESPEFLDQKTIPIEEAAELLGIELPLDTPLYMEESRTESGRVKQIGIEGHFFSGREFREKLNLKSSDFTIRQNNNHLVITTEGYGHGVGMSQYGANFMAQEGKTYQDIVKHFYQGVEISTIEDSVPTLLAKK